MSTLDIIQIPVLNDNYIYLVHDFETKETAAVDPAVSQLVLLACCQRNWRLTYILNTHHHADHTQGNLELKKNTHCQIVGAANDEARIPGINIRVCEGDVVRLGGHNGYVLEIPGHTHGHIAYWFAEAQALFCGDTLFSLGCGKIFEGTAAQMWNSLLKIRSLPDNTQIFCAHEYTETNANFALSIDPNNVALKARAKEVLRLRQSKKPTVPSTLSSEKMTNPFLRADARDLQSALNMEGFDPVSVFTEIRSRKDQFQNT